MWDTKSSQIYKDKSRMVVTRRWGRGKLFNGYGLSVWEDEKILKMDDDVSCTTMWMYLMPLNCTLLTG